MKTAVVYVFPQVKVHVYQSMADRFARTSRQFPGGADHELHVMLNGASPEFPGAVNLESFGSLPLQPHYYNNLGWDVGAFQWAAENIPCDLMVCLGAPVHFHWSGWLERMIDTYLRLGPGLYGCWAYVFPTAHIRTTAFWCSPELLQSYPEVVGSSRPSRYAWEHGKHSFTAHVMKSRFPCAMVTRNQVFEYGRWNGNAPGTDRSLLLDQHCHR